MDVNLLHREFEEVLQQEPENRGAYLAKLSQSEPDLSERLKKLLDSLPSADRIFETPIQENNPLSPYMDNPETMINNVPDRIGNYTILNRIGGGGMGEVYEAVMETPVYREVALKLVKPGARDDELLQRLQVERQALVQLNHNHVVRVFDVGATEAGQPWFTMEFLKDGMTLTKWCDQHKATIQQRIELFLQACEGVIHAHERGLIHGDLKPSNILVTMQGGKAVVKIIDFGTALEADGLGLATSGGKIFGAPAYISPEQTQPEGAVTTRSDLYTLAVVLYELLTGTPMADPQAFPTASAYDKLTQIRELVHPSPSSTYRKGSHARETAAKLGLDPQAAAKRLQGDLDWILARALQKDPSERYNNLQDLKTDLENAFNDMPVAAAPPSRLYRAKKYVRRHRSRVALYAALAFSLIMMLATGATVFIKNKEALTLQLEVAQLNMERAAGFGLMLEVLMGQASPYNSGADVTLIEAVNLTSEYVINSPDINREVKIHALFSFGQTAMGNGIYDTAETNFQRLLDLYQNESDPYTFDHARAWTLLGMSQSARSQSDEAMESLNRALDILGHLEADADTAYLNFRIQATLSSIYRMNDNGELAKQHYEQAIAMLQQTEGVDPSHIMEGKALLAQLTVSEGFITKGIELHKQVLDYRQTTFGPEDQMVLISKSSLADALIKSKKADHLDTAVQLLEEILPAIRQRSIPRNPKILAVQDRLAQAYSDLDRHEKALKIINSAVSEYRELRDLRDPHLISARVTQAGIIGETGNIDGAIQILEDCVTYYNTAPLNPADHKPLRAKNNLAHFLNKANRPAEALVYLQQVFDSRVQSRGPDDHLTLGTEANIALARHRLGQLEQAAGRYKDVIRRFEAAYPQRVSRAAAYRLAYVECLVDMNRLEAAQSQLDLIKGPLKNQKLANEYDRVQKALEAAESKRF